MKTSRLILKINRAFLIQVILITLTALLSVYLAKIMIEEVLIKSAVQSEADYFWLQYQQDKTHPLPKTKNLTGYFNKQNLPESIKIENDTAGFYEFHQDQNAFVLLISTKHNQKLYLLYNRGQVDYLVAYYGLIPFSIGLALLYLAVWLTYKISRRTVSPIIQLASQVNEVDFKSNDLSQIHLNKLSTSSDDDIKILSDAIAHLGERLNAFIARERHFTRDASHELRTPLTIIKMATDILLSDESLPQNHIENIERIQHAVQDMEELTEAFLLLARESDEQLKIEIVSINQVIKEELETAKLLIEDKPIKLELVENSHLEIKASKRVLAILLGNLIRNSALYTEQGCIQIEIKPYQVIIRDTGPGIAKSALTGLFSPFVRGDNQPEPGYGVGLTIVKRLSDRFFWPIQIDSELGNGTVITVEFHHNAFA